MQWRIWCSALLGASAATWILLAAPAPPRGIEDLRRGFEQPPDEARVMMRWWWFGPAVAKPELEREMRSMKEAGIGGFEVQPVYRKRQSNPPFHPPAAMM
jgi:hypothetical protein